MDSVSGESTRISFGSFQKQNRGTCTWSWTCNLGQHFNKSPEQQKLRSVLQLTAMAQVPLFVVACTPTITTSFRLIRLNKAKQTLFKRYSTIPHLGNRSCSSVLCPGVQHQVQECPPRPLERPSLSPDACSYILHKSEQSPAYKSMKGTVMIW